MGVSCHIEYKSSPSHKTVYNYIIPYFIILMITDLEVLKEFENK